MENTAFPGLAAVATAGLLWLLAGCQPREPEAHGLAFVGTDLRGRWRYDSAGAAFYDRRGHFSHRFMDPLPPEAWLTIGPQQWTYSGSVREAHAYVRQGNTVRVCRVVDTALVRAGHARQEAFGRVIGFADTLLLTTLTPHRLVLRDSATDPDGALTRVWRYYYSR